MMTGVVCAVLAAGASRRLGQSKQLVRLKDRPLVRIVAEECLASRCDATAVVVGADAHDVVAALGGCSVVTLSNEAWRDGMASSIRCAVTWAQEIAAPGLLLVSVDQLALTSAHLDRMLEVGLSHEPVETALVGSVYAGVVGIPALFGRHHYAYLSSLTGDNGARALLRDAALLRDVATRVQHVPFVQGECDLDEPRDLGRNQLGMGPQAERGAEAGEGPRGDSLPAGWGSASDPHERQVGFQQEIEPPVP